jgi:Tfp pilus assembly protein PilN
MSSQKAARDPVVGGEPRVDLLPAEIATEQKGRRLRRGIGGMVMVVVLVTGAGIAAATWYAQRSQASLAGVQARTSELLAAQGEYSEVRRVKEDVDATIAARQLAASVDIDWAAYLQQIRTRLPGDVVIGAVVLDAESPWAPYVQATAPLQPSRVATISLTLTSPTLPSVPDWLDDMATLPGYADSAPTRVVLLESGAYEVSLTLHVNAGAFSNRFGPAEVTQ